MSPERVVRQKLLVLIFSSNKSEHGENTADILLSLKNVVVHPPGVSPASSQSPSPSQQVHQPPPYPDLGQQVGGWEESQAHHYSNMQHNAQLYSVDGFGWTNPAFSPRPVSSSLGSPSHHFPTMSVNVSMNMTMHGVGYDPVADQWQHGYDQGQGYGPGYGQVECGYGVMVRDEEDEASVKEEEINNPRSFALFDSPSKFRMQSKGSSHSQFYDKQVRNSEENYEQY